MSNSLDKTASVGSSNSQTVNKPPNLSNQPNRNLSKPCFKCGDRYFPGHVCKNKSIVALKMEARTGELREGNKAERE